MGRHPVGVLNVHSMHLFMHLFMGTPRWRCMFPFHGETPRWRCLFLLRSCSFCHISPYATWDNGYAADSSRPLRQCSHGSPFTVRFRISLDGPSPESLPLHFMALNGHSMHLSMGRHPVCAASFRDFPARFSELATPASPNGPSSLPLPVVLPGPCRLRDSVSPKKDRKETRWRHLARGSLLSCPRNCGGFSPRGKENRSWQGQEG